MSWPQVPLRRLFRVVNGGTPKADEENWNGSTPWVTPVDLSTANGRRLDETRRYLTETGVRSGSKRIPAGSIIVSARAPIGYVAQVSKSMALNQGCRGLVADGDVDIRYYRYQLSVMTRLLESQGMGSTFMELSTDALRSILVDHPPLESQRQIADFLDQFTSSMDHVGRLRFRQYDALRELTLSEINHVLARVEDAPQVKLGRYSRVQFGLTLDAGRARTGAELRYPYLRVANVQDGWLDLADVATTEVDPRRASKVALRDGDVLMTEGGDLDKLGRGTVWRGDIQGCLHQNHVFAIRPDRRSLSPEFLAILTRSAYGREYFERTGNRTTNLASTNSSAIRNFPIPLITIREQAEVVGAAEERLARVEELKRTLERQLSLLGERRHALTALAVAGEIDVTTARGIEI